MLIVFYLVYAHSPQVQEIGRPTGNSFLDLRMLMINNSRKIFFANRSNSAKRWSTWSRQKLKSGDQRCIFLLLFDIYINLYSVVWPMLILSVHGSSYFLWFRNICFSLHLINIGHQSSFSLWPSAPKVLAHQARQGCEVLRVPVASTRWQKYK